MGTVCRVDLSANRNANLEARASNRTIIQPSNDSCANYRTRGSWCLPTEPRRSSGWCLGTKRVLFSCPFGLALLALSCHAAASQKWHSFAALVVVHVEAIYPFEEANHRRSGGCSDLICC